MPWDIVTLLMTMSNVMTITSKKMLGLLYEVSPDDMALD